jgi:RNA polymerase sigma-70 factor, ECF subfamily
LGRPHTLIKHFEELLGSKDNRATLTPALNGCGRNATTSARRRRTELGWDDDLALSVADPADGPDSVLEKKARAELVRQCLARLSPEHSEVIDLVYYHEKSVEEVTRIVGIPEATVKTRMFYARKKLAELVAGAQQAI